MKNSNEYQNQEHLRLLSYVSTNFPDNPRIYISGRQKYFPLAPFARSYRVTDEASIVETAVWSIFFLLMNVVFALKGFRLFILI